MKLLQIGLITFLFSSMVCSAQERPEPRVPGFRPTPEEQLRNLVTSTSMSMKQNDVRTVTEKVTETNACEEAGAYKIHLEVRKDTFNRDTGKYKKVWERVKTVTVSPDLTVNEVCIDHPGD